MDPGGWPSRPCDAPVGQDWQKPPFRVSGRPRGPAQQHPSSHVAESNQPPQHPEPSWQAPHGGLEEGCHQSNTLPGATPVTDLNADQLSGPQGGSCLLCLYITDLLLLAEHLCPPGQGVLLEMMVCQKGRQLSPHIVPFKDDPDEGTADEGWRPRVWSLTDHGGPPVLQSIHKLVAH